MPPAPICGLTGWQWLLPASIAADAIARAGLVNPNAGEKVAAVLDAIVTRVNMVNAIYEREVSIHFNLVPDNAKLVYLDAATDPVHKRPNGLDAGAEPRQPGCGDRQRQL